MLGGSEPRAAAVVDSEGYIAITLQPQLLEDLKLQRKRELLFVMDSSCSMSGEPWHMTVDAVDLALAGMETYDTFNLVRFSSDSSSLFNTPKPATKANIAKARHWMGKFEGGGTNVMGGLRHSLRMGGDPEAIRLILLMTDGYIGIEKQIFRQTEQELGDARIFALGVGSSVNRMLLEGVARAGRGSVQYQLPRTPLQETVDRFYARIAHPAMTDVEIDFGGLDVYDVYPSRPPDLWAGQPAQVVGRVRDGSSDVEVTISGEVDGEPYRLRLPVDIAGAREHEAVRQLWARSRIEDVKWDLFAHAQEKQADITETALEHHLVSEHTSLVAVENAPSTCGAATREVAVEHYGPEGTRLDQQGMAGTNVGGIGGLLGRKGRQKGSAGLGSRGSGLGGGGTADGLAGLGTRGIGSGTAGYGRAGATFGAAGEAIGSVGGEPIILGALDRTVIDEVVKRHMNQIRYCYQRQLSKKPKLAGKIVVRFTVAADGTVSKAEIKSSTMNDELVENCIIGRFQRMQFPAPKGEGVIIVSYPFQFSHE